MRGFVVPLLVLSLFGCASQNAAVSTESAPQASSTPTLPAYFADPVHVAPPSCPDESHVRGIGQSPQGREAAAHLAKKDLLSKINSTIQVQAESFSRDVFINGKTTSEFRQAATLLEKIEFTHADLIRDAETPFTADGQTHIALCLSRAEAISRLEADLAPEVTRFETWFEAANRAFDGRDPPALVKAFKNLNAAMVAASPTLVQIRALAKGPTPVGQRLATEWLSIIAKVEDWRSRVRFSLHCESDSRLQPANAKVTESIRKSLVPFGNDVRIEGTCPAAVGDNRSINYLIRVSATVGCQRTSLGTTCTPAVEIRGDECASGRQVFDLNLKRLGASVTDPGGEERALRRLMQRIDEATVSDDLKVALKSEIP